LLVLKIDTDGVTIVSGIARALNQKILLVKKVTV
jgi:tRNA-binding EMAP/Myf-like protein